MNSIINVFKKHNNNMEKKNIEIKIKSRNRRNKQAEIQTDRGG